MPVQGAGASGGPAYSSCAWTETETLPRRAPEIGQPSPAALAAAWKSAGEIPGTFPVTRSSIVTTFHASPTLSNVAVASTDNRVGGFCWRPSPAESAMQKQAACAAASSSSGLVFPPDASVRDAQETAVSGSPPLMPFTRPCPWARSPSHTACAVRFAAIGGGYRGPDLTSRTVVRTRVRYFSGERPRRSMGGTITTLPRFLIIEPVSTVRLEMELDRPSCEIDVELQNPGPGRSFVVMIGHRGGPFVQRLRLSGRARIVFEPKTPGQYVLVLANPLKEPLVLRLKGRQTAARLGEDASAGRRAASRPHRRRGVRRRTAIRDRRAANPPDPGAASGRVAGRRA